MWIRSQNKKFLGDYSFIYGFQNEIRAESNTDVDTLGTYQTSERATEVMDEIQLRLINGTRCDDIRNGIRVQKEIVYEMPGK